MQFSFAGNVKSNRRSCKGGENQKEEQAIACSSFFKGHDAKTRTFGRMAFLPDALLPHYL